MSSLTDGGASRARASCCDKTLAGALIEFVSAAQGKLHAPAVSQSLQDFVEVHFPEAIRMATDPHHPVHEPAPDFGPLGVAPRPPANARFMGLWAYDGRVHSPSALEHHRCPSCETDLRFALINWRFIVFLRFFCAAAHREEPTDLAAVHAFLSGGGFDYTTAPAGMSAEYVAAAAWLVLHETAHGALIPTLREDVLPAEFAARRSDAMEEVGADLAAARLLHHRCMAQAPMSAGPIAVVHTGIELLLRSLSTLDAWSSGTPRSRHEFRNRIGPFAPSPAFREQMLNRQFEVVRKVLARVMTGWDEALAERDRLHERVERVLHRVETMGA